MAMVGKKKWFRPGLCVINYLEDEPGLALQAQAALLVFRLKDL